MYKEVQMLNEGPQRLDESALEPTPIYNMNAIIDLMLKMHPHLLEYFNPDGSFHQFLIRKYGHNSIGFEFAHDMEIYLPEIKNKSTDSRTIRDLYIDALELMPDTKGFSMAQYLKHSNKILYVFFEQNMHILDGLYTEFLVEKQQNKELRKLVALLKEQRAQWEQEAWALRKPKAQSVAPQEEDSLEETQGSSSCHLVKPICHQFSCLVLDAPSSQDTPTQDVEVLKDDKLGNKMLV